MKLFYHCFGGAHTSITCAAIHLGYLPMDRTPNAREFISVAHYDKMEDENRGTPLYIGRDELGIDIYAIGLKNACNIMIPAIKSYLSAIGVQQKDILFVESLIKLHPMTGVGGFLSRKLNMVALGRPLTIWGIRRRYSVFVDLVSGVKENLCRNFGMS